MPRRSRKRPSARPVPAPPAAAPGGYAMSSFLIHGRQKTAHWDYAHHVVPPLSASSTFRLESNTRGEAGFCGFADPAKKGSGKPPIYIYERLDEPVRAMLEERLAQAEGAETSVCFSTGMAAIAAAVCHRLRAGDEVVAHPTLYGCTYSLLTNWLPRFGVRVRYHDLVHGLGRLNLGARTRVVYCETPANPTLQIVDLEAVAERVAEANHGRRPEQRIRLVVDNTFATPACQRPLQHGADVSCASLTKGINGFGTDMGGYVATGKQDESSLLVFRKDFGASLAPTPAWRVLNFGLPTLDLRTRKQEENALALADFLSRHPKVTRLQYPGHPACAGYEVARRQMQDFSGRFAPGTLLYFEVGRGGKAAAAQADRVVDAIAKNAYAITLAVSLGQIRTLIERPGGMTHSVLPKEVAASCGIGAGGIRLAVGIEELADLQRDLEQALRRI